MYFYLKILTPISCCVVFRDDNAGDPTRLGPARIRPAHRGLARPAPYNLCGLQSLACPTPHLACFLIFFNFYDKIFNV